MQRTGKYEDEYKSTRQDFKKYQKREEKKQKNQQNSLLQKGGNSTKAETN